MLLLSSNSSFKNYLKSLCTKRFISSANSAYSKTSNSISNRSIKSTQEMNDEYGAMDSSGKLFKVDSFALENGVVLKEAQICYNTFGTLNDAKDNLMIVCHALTGNSRVDQWWGEMLGPNKVFDTEKYFVLCANVLGSCYGSSGPQSIDPDTGKVYGNKFPQVTIRDSVRLQVRLVQESLGVRSVRCVIGGSMGGMQALEWCAITSHEQGPEVKSAVVIGCGAQHTAWQIGISETQRQAIYADPKWRNGDVDMSDPPNSGLSVARQIAMISYRTQHGYESKFGRRTQSDDKWEVTSYLEYQGAKFIQRFDPVTYVKLTEKMDRHDISRGREGGVEGVLTRITSDVLVMGIDSDLLYPLAEQQQLAAHIPKCRFRVINSPAGHDGFLLEQDQVCRHITELLSSL